MSILTEGKYKAGNGYLHQQVVNKNSSIMLAALLGITILAIAGFATSAHDTAHDMRHAIGFACH